MKMKAEDKAKWLEALRSGEYNQIDNTLHAEGAYCCLGVLQKVLDGSCEADAPQPTKAFLAKHEIEVETNDADIFGVITESPFPFLASGGTYAKLMELNDELERDEYDGEPLLGRHVNTFDKIADYIEQNVEVYD
jgi:hypothetical protein